MALMSLTLLFVYGTLRSGQSHQHLLDGQTLHGPARTLPRYRLLDCGAYPGLIEVPGGGLAVHGELWEVDEGCLQRLDVYEGMPELFIRAPVELSCDHAPRSAVAYFYGGERGRCRDCGDRWPPQRQTPRGQ